MVPEEPSVPQEHSAQQQHSAHQPEDHRPAEADRLADSEHAALEAFAAGDLSLAEHHPESFFNEAAVLKGNAMGIIHEGDGSTNAEKVQRLLMLVPALLTVVDEARDTISRLRDIEDRLNPGPGGSIRVPEGTGTSPNPLRLEQRLYIRASAREVGEAIASGVPGSPGQHAGRDVSWRVITVGANLSVVVWHRETDPPADAGHETASESDPGSAAGGWNYRLSAVKTWLETGSPLV